ncbi:MAG: hypothetical protein LBG27_08430, partial [Spirochaetaceae bacterium]|nr:hypothetical protein [Spirochaetaceae bacterium]
ERKMPFKKRMCFMPGMVKESSQGAPGRFFPEIKEAAHMRQAGVQPGAAKSETGSLLGIVPGKRAGKL